MFKRLRKVASIGLQWTGVRLEIRPRLADGGYGRRSEHNPIVKREVALLLIRGSEVPVLLDYATGEVGSIDVKALTKELEPRFEEARERDRTTPAQPSWGEVASSIKGAFDDWRDEPPPETVEGVTAEHWLAARSARKRFPDAPLDGYGLPPGRWEALDAEWTARAAADPAHVDK